MTSLTIGCTIIGESAFSECGGLTSLTISNGVKEIGASAFSSCSSLVSVIIPESVTKIGAGAFFDCNGLTSVAIPNSVTSIDDRTFDSCYGLTSITIPNSITSIGWCAFDNCYNLNSVTIPEGVVSIEKEAFHGCSGLNSLTIPKSVKSIGYKAFCCSGLTSVDIPENVETIGNAAFAEVDMSNVVSHLKVPFAISGISNFYKTFSQNTFNNAILYVPIGTIDKYKATDGWKDFANIVEGDPASIAEVHNESLFIKNEGNNLTIEGADDGEQVNVYTTNGVQAGSAISKNGKAMVNTNLQKGEIAIVKVGEKSVKVVVK